MEEIEVVELEPAILKAARFFDEHNNRILDDQRTRIVANDGRNHLLLAAPGTFDVIVSEPSNPWISGVSNLFTREFFQMGKARLKPGGVWSQWVQLYGMGQDELKTLLATFADVYPYVALYMTVEDADVVLLGSEQPLTPDPDTVQAMLERWPLVKDQVQQIHLTGRMDIVSTWQMSRDEILKMTEGVERNTDDNMLIEYRAPLTLHSSDTAAANAEMLLDHAVLPLMSVQQPQELVWLSRVYLERNDWGRCMLAMIEALDRIGRNAGFDSTALKKAQQRMADGEWVQAVSALIVAATDLMEQPDVPEWLFDAWTDWRKKMYIYLGGEKEDSAVQEE